MNGRGGHLLVVTSRYPFGYQESYLNTELDELRQYFDRVTIVPVRSPEGVRRHTVPEGIDVLEWPVLNVEIVARAVAAALTAPVRSCSAIVELVASHDPGKTKN